MNEWKVNGDIWSWINPEGYKLIQVRWDTEFQEYAVAPTGHRLGKSWDDARRAAENLVTQPQAQARKRKKGE